MALGIATALRSIVKIIKLTTEAKLLAEDSGCNISIDGVTDGAPGLVVADLHSSLSDCATTGQSQVSVPTGGVPYRCTLIWGEGERERGAKKSQMCKQKRKGRKEGDTSGLSKKLRSSNIQQCSFSYPKPHK